jgi:hypothetical protein
MQNKEEIKSQIKQQQQQQQQQQALPSIDFDLKIDDYNKCLFLVKNVLLDESRAAAQNRSLSNCDLFNESECHHDPNSCERHIIDAANDAEKCTFCQFYDLINDRDSSIKLNSDNLKFLGITSTISNTNLNQKYSNLNIRFRKNTGPTDFAAEWYQFQPYRRPYALICFASCTTQLDLYNAVRKYEQEKEKYKNCVLLTRLFIDLHLKHEMNDEFKACLNLNNSQNSNSNSCSFNLESSPYLNSENPSFSSSENFDKFRNTVSIEINEIPPPNESSDDSSKNIELDEVEVDSGFRQGMMLNKDFGGLSVPKFNHSFISGDFNNSRDIHNLLTANSLSRLHSFMSHDSSSVVDEAELAQKMASIEKEIVYLDFLFSKDGADKIVAIVESEKAKIYTCLKECLLNVARQLSERINTLDLESDRQINFYSEYLKTPLDKTSTTSQTVSNSSLLSIKVISKKIVVARMHKHKADLFLILNCIQSALYHYYQAFNLSKKEEDTIWSVSALDGLCAASYVHQLESYRVSMLSNRNSFAGSTLEGNFFKFKNGPVELRSEADWFIF